MVEISAQISQDNPFHFKNHSEFLKYFRSRLLPICRSSSNYLFNIRFVSGEDAITNMVESILQMSEINCCSSVEIEIDKRTGQKALPAEAISDWLEKIASGVKVHEKVTKEKYLKIKMFGIRNTREIHDHLKEVCLIPFIHIMICLCYVIYFKYNFNPKFAN